MPTLNHAEAATRPINLRVREDVRTLIDRAARAQGRTRSDFMIEAARRAAEDALLDQTLFAVSEATYESFLARLDEVPQTNERLRKTLQTPAPWEAA